MTLPEDKQAATKEPTAVGSDDVHRVVKHTIQMLKDTTQKRRRPLLAVRNLYTLLDEEKFSNVEKRGQAGSFVAGRSGRRPALLARSRVISER